MLGRVITRTINHLRIYWSQGRFNSHFRSVISTGSVQRQYQVSFKFGHSRTVPFGLHSHTVTPGSTSCCRCYRHTRTPGSIRRCSYSSTPSGQDVAVQFGCVKFDKSLPSLRTSSSTRRCRSSCTSSPSRRCRTVRVSSTSNRCSSVRVSSSRWKTWPFIQAAVIRLKILPQPLVWYTGRLSPTSFQCTWLGLASGTTSVFEHSLSGFHYRQQTDDGH